MARQVDSTITDRTWSAFYLMLIGLFHRKQGY